MGLWIRRKESCLEAKVCKRKQRLLVGKMSKIRPRESPFKAGEA